MTGSSRGLGLEIARACAAAGARVVVASRSGEAIDRAVAELRAGGAQASGIACDVSDRGQVEALARHALDAFGRFDEWVNNAGLSRPLWANRYSSLRDFLRTIQTNIIGTYYGSMVR